MGKIKGENTSTRGKNDDFKWIKFREILTSLRNQTLEVRQARRESVNSQGITHNKIKGRKQVLGDISTR